MSDKIIYRLNENISFRTCSLYDGDDSVHGDCTNFTSKDFFLARRFSCFQNGIHFHCTRHPEIELELHSNPAFVSLTCPRCENEIEIVSRNHLMSECLKMMNRDIFKDAKLIRLDDWYTHEVKTKSKPDKDYWITANVKTDRDGDTVVVLYVGYNGSKDKSQFFIKPEKAQLSSDHKDLDPAKVLTKIEVTLKDRLLIQEYDI